MRSFNTYIRLLIGESRISATALAELNEIASTIADKISTDSEKMLQITNKKTLSPDHVLSALRLNPETNVVNRAIGRANRALKEFTRNISERGKGETPQRMEVRAGLKISVSLCKSYLKAHLRPEERLAKTAPVALAAIIEDIVGEISGLSSNAVRDNKVATIIPRHVMFAIYGDEEFTSFLTRIGYVMRTGGSIPHIHSKLVTKTKANKNKNPIPRSKFIKAPHRFRPGTVSLRNIRRYQKSDQFLVSLSTSKKIISAASDGLRLSKAAHLAFHRFLESETVSVLEDAQVISLHAGRITVSSKDVNLAFHLRYDKLLPGVYGNVGDEGPLKKPEVERLSYRAGIKTRSSDVHIATSSWMNRIMNHLVAAASKSASAFDRKTIQPKDVRMSFDALGIAHGAI